MSDRPRLHAKRAASPIAEGELAAVSASLFARPALWRDIVLPPDARGGAEQAPWSGYWSVRLGSLADAAADRAVLAAAAAAFEARGERLGLALATAAAIETYYYDETGLEPLDGWIAQLERALGAEAAAELQSECAAEVMACGCGMLLRQPRHALLAEWAARAPRLLTRLAPGPSRLKYAAFVVQYHLWRGEFR